MLNITPSTLQAINTPNKISEGQYLYQNGTPTDLIIKNTEYKNLGTLNTSNMKSLVIELVGEHDLQGEWFNYIRELETETKHSIDYGLFRVIEQEYKIDEDVTVITLFDKMINTHKDVHEDEFDLTFPTTLGAVFNNVIAICELETSTPTFDGHDLPISADVWTNTSYTYRDILSQIAEVLTAQIQVINGKVDVYYGEETTVEISNFRTKTLEIGKKIEGFNILNVTQEPQHWNTPYPSDWHTIPIEDRKEYVIQNNAIIDLNRTLYSPIVFNKIKDISYTPFRADTFGWGIFDIGDIVSIKDENGVIHKSIVTSELGKFKQMFLSEVISSKIEHAKDEYVVATDEQRQGQTVYFLVDQQNGIIEGLVNKVDEVEDETARLAIEVGKISTEVENIHLGNILPNANGSEDYVGWTGDGETLYADENMLYLQDITYGTVAIPKMIEGSKSEYGWEYYNKGTMYSSYMRVIPEELKYSFRAKTGNFKPIKFTLYEYNEDVREDSNIEPSEETVYNIISPMQYITFTHTNKNDTKFMMLGIEIATSTIDSRTTLTEIMFNAREPKEWFKSADDVAVYSKSLFEQLSNKMVLMVNSDGKVVQAELGVNPDDGSYFVVSADNISLNGYTEINGKFRVNKDGTVYMQDAFVEGTINAVRGEIGNFEIESGVLTYTSPIYEREYTQADLSTIRTIIMKDLEPTQYEIYIYDTTGDNKVTAMDYMQINNYLKGDRDKPKRPMIQSQVSIGTNNGQIISTVLYENGQVGANTTIQADNVSTGTLETTGLSISGQSVEVDSNGFLKLV